ncbi:MAG: Ig-like domain-containing protein [Chitinivibrionales bacterium]
MRGFICFLLFAATLSAGDLDLYFGTYLGGSGADEVSGADIGSNREIVITGSFSSTDLDVTSTEINGGGNGGVVRVTSEGEILSFTSVPDRIDDMEIAKSSGRIGVIGEFGTYILSSDASEILWEKPALNLNDGGSVLGPGRRISIGSDGTVAVLYGKSFAVYNAGSDLIGTGSVNRDHVNDISVDGDNNQIIVVSFDQKHTCSNPVQIAAVDAFSYTGTAEWTSYGFDATPEIFCDGPSGNQMADSRALLVTVGPDGKIYFAAESAGGNTIFRYNGKDVVTETIQHYDKFTQAYNTVSNHITYVGRMDKDGVVEKGQLFISRQNDPPDAGNTVNPRCLDIDTEGNIYVGGKSAYNIDDSDGLFIEGQEVTTAGGFVLISDNEFTTRKLWTTFATDAYSSTVYGVAAGKGITAIASTVNDDYMVTSEAFQTDAHSPSESNPEIYVAAWEGETDWSGILVDITSPTSSEVFSVGDDITLGADVSVTEGSVAQVEFMVDGSSVGTDTDEPYEVVWSDAPEGEHTAKAVVTSSSAEQESVPVEFLVKGESVASDIAISPSNLTMVTDASYEFSATVYDQYGLVMSGQSVSWSADKGSFSGAEYTTPTDTGIAVITAECADVTETADINVVDGIYTDLKINFQNSNSSVVPGYLADVGEAYGDRGNGETYGWSANNTDNARYRSSEDEMLWATFNHLEQIAGGVSWEIEVPNGDYHVKIGSGDPDYTEAHRIDVEDVLIVEGETSESDHRVTGEGDVTVSDGRLTVSNHPNPSVETYNKIAWIEIKGLDPTDDQVGVTNDHSAKELFSGTNPSIVMRNGMYFIRGGNTDRISVKVFDIRGRIKSRLTSKKGEPLGLKENLSSGMYIIRAEYGEGRSLTRMINLVK